jgi:lysozyme
MGAMSVKEVFDKLRSMSGGTLSTSQVQAGDKIIDSLGLDVLAALLNYSIVLKPSKGNPTELSSKGMLLLEEFEGFRDKAYKDSAGIWTIGFGTIKYPTGVPVKQGDTCTREEARLYKVNDLKWVYEALQSVKVPLNQNEYDALCSFVYNVGATAFKQSTLLRVLNQSKRADAANEFMKWTRAGGKVVQGLVNRRAKEKALFLS